MYPVITLFLGNWTSRSLAQRVASYKTPGSVVQIFTDINNHHNSFYKLVSRDEEILRLLIYLVSQSNKFQHHDLNPGSLALDIIFVAYLILWKVNCIGTE
jgi:hypothetical protein